MFLFLSLCFYVLLQLNIDNDDDEEEQVQEPEEVDLQDVFNEPGDEGVEEVIWEAKEEAEVKAAVHAAELADMAEELQIPSLTLTSAQESATESVGKMARLKMVSVQIFIQLVFNPKHCVLYSFLNVPCHKTKLKMFWIVYKCECVFFRMRNFTWHTMKREEQFLQEMKFKRRILFTNMRVNFAHTKQ